MKSLILLRGRYVLSGIIFLGTNNIEQIKSFYTDKLGFILWHHKEDCIILRHGNLLLGFCKREKIDNEGLLSIFFPEKEIIDMYYLKLKDFSISKPEIDPKYGVYRFFIKDPEGRLIELMSFAEKSIQFLTGDELLLTRRSIREFENKEVPDEVLWKIFELCRWSPTSKNSQSYYLIVIKNKEVLEKLAALRGISSSPIGNAPMAVAICSNPNKSRRHVQDACIAAYHFLLACWIYGLGTCWIAAMDRDDVKEMLNIPKNHYIATITPVGYPKYIPEPPPRKPAEEFVKIFS